MTDAQPADQLVAALEAMERHMFDHDGRPGSGHDQLLQRVRGALPIAREMAERERAAQERERELERDLDMANARVALLRKAFGNNATRLHGPIHVGGHVPLDWRIATCDLCAILANSDDAAKALFDRARAAGVEVTGHE